MTEEKKNSDGHCGEKQGGVSSQEEPYRQQGTPGCLGQPFPPDLGWEGIAHKKGGGQREIRVQICYSPSLKGLSFSESGSYLGRESHEVVFPGKICGLL